MAQLVNDAGVTVFEGEISGALPTGWTDDGGNPAVVSTNGGALLAFPGSVQGALLTGGAVLLAFPDPGSPTKFFHVYCGEADPTTAGGQSGARGSLYMRDTGATGELWIKTGATNTDWTKVTP